MPDDKESITITADTFHSLLLTCHNFMAIIIDELEVAKAVKRSRDINYWQNHLEKTAQVIKNAHKEDK